MISDADWLLVVDASLSHRLAKELRDRGRNALSLRELRLDRASDRALLRLLRREWPLATLVTADDHLPEEHRDLLARWGLTVAVVDPLFLPPYTQEQWKRDIVHRWAHKMQTQRRGTILRYSVRAGGRLWTRPRHPAGSPSARLPAPSAENPEHYREELQSRANKSEAGDPPLSS